MGIIVVYLMEFVCDMFDWKVGNSIVCLLFKECFVLLLWGLKIESEVELELRFKDVVIDMF